MYTVADFTSTLFAGLWRASWQAAVLIGLVVLLQRLLSRRLTPSWCHALWLLVLARLLLPATPATSWSLFNWLPGGAVSAPVTEAPTAAPALVVGPAAAEVASGANAALRTPSPGGQEPRPVLPPAAAPVPAPARFAPTAPPAVAAAPGPDGFVAPVVAGETAPRRDAPTVVRTPLGTWLWSSVWLAGVLALAARVVLASVRFRRALRGSKPVTDEDFARLLAECRQHLRVRRAVQAFETERVQSPALCGWWRPRLLLPVGLTCRLTRDELRHVLLHELAHLKRGDICVNWLATAAQVLHWFNPAVWYALRRMRADRELAADHLALAVLGEPQARSYGQTILKLLESFTQPVAGPAAVGILEGRDAIRERIAAVAAFRQPGRWSSLASLLFVGLGLVALTDARPRAADAVRANAPGVAAGETSAFVGEAPFRPLNLTPHYVTRWDAIKPGTSWSAVPQGRQTFGDVPFELGGLLELSGLGALRDDKQFPTRVEGIAVGGRVAALHLLHGAGYDAVEGAPIAKLVLRYADGQTAELPLAYGVHVRNWWVERSEKSAALTDPASHVAWTGTSPETDAFGVTLRLFHTRLPNPRPDLLVASLDVVSLLTRATPVILGVTVEAPGAASAVASPATTAGVAAPAVPTAGECRLLVVAADTGRPIPGARVRLQVSDARGDHSFGEYRANREGRVTLDFPPEGISQFTLQARAPGYVLRQEIVPGPSLPRDLTLRLEPGVQIGGVVRDDRGQPVAGAQVQVNGLMRDAAGQFVEIELEKVVTDAAGRWTCRSAPSNPAGLNFKLGHSEFFPAEYDQAEEPGEGLVTTRSLLAGEAVMTLQPGIEVTGRVVSGEGVELQPVAEAEVLLASGEGLATRRHMRTDAAGRFRLVALETGEAVVLARARGQAPELRKITLVRGLAPLEFQLQPGRTVEGRVTDERGQPVPGAVVTIERWRDLSLLDWRAETDAEGRFRWETAPLDRVTLAVSKGGYSRTVQEVDAAAGREVTLHLTRTFRFTGRVVDAETGQPVTAFRLVRGDVWGSLEPDHANWEPGRERPISSPDGTFSLGLDYDSGSAVRFMAVAEGYLPEVSPVLAPTGWHEYTFKLKKGEGPQGIVVNAAGQPVAGAEVAIVGMGYLQLARGAFSQLGPKPLGLVRTDSEGRFKLPALLPRPKLLAVHPEHGFAEISAEELATAGRIVLQPWGRVEGVMKIGSKVATNQEVALVNRSMGPGDWYLDFNEYKTRTDAEGRFTIEKAPPGERQLMRPIPIQNGWSWSHRQPLTVKAGEVTRVVYGGTGRPVIGKVILSDPQRQIEWPGGHHSLSTLFPQPPPDQRTPEGWRAWQQSPEYKQALANHRTYAPTWQPDGSFRFDDVLPGKYQLSLMFMDPGERFPRTSIGSITREVEVPEIPGGQTDEPLDLGELRLALRSEQEIAAERARQAGSVARSASAVSQVSTLDGGTFDLQQMEGKFVLMTMWSATNEASRAELQMLRELQAEYAGDPRFLMLGQVFDDDPAPARKLVAELGIDWVQLLAPADWRRDFPQMYPGVELPASVFIKVGEATKPEPLRGLAVRDAVRKALGEPVKPTEKAAAEKAAEPAPTPKPGTSHSTAAAPVSTAADPGLIVHDSAPPELRGITPRLWAAVFSPDGRTLATTAGWDNPREPGELVLWEVASGRPRVVVRQENTIRTAAFSPDGRRLAIGDFAGQITILDPATGEELLKLPQQTKLVNSVVFTPDGRTLVSGGFDETVRLWDPDTGEARRAFVLPGEGVTTVAVSPNGEWLAAGTWPGKVHLWRLATLEKVREISLKSGRTVEVVSFSPDSALLSVGGWDGEVLLQAVATGADGPRLERARTGVMSAAFAPDGRTLAIGDDQGTIELWSLPNGTRLGTIPAHEDRCHGLAFSPDGRRLATAGWDRVVKIWKVDNRQLEATLSR